MARIDSLGHFLTDVADAIRNKKGSSGTIQASSFDTEIASIPSGGGGAVEKKDINFYDYDGTILHSYTKSEFNNLEAMPDNPIHEGLTSMGWNWTLQEGKTYLISHSYIEIGQVYQLTNSSIEIYVSIDKYTLNPYVTFAVNGTATIDWGDNTTPDTITGTSASSMIDTSHTYSSGGDYVIKISSTSDIRLSAGDGNYGSKIFWLGTANYENIRYLNCIKKVFLSNNIIISNNFTFLNCYNLEEVILPNNGATIGTDIFSNCYKLKHITTPKQSGYIIPNNFLRYCYGLKSISIGNGTQRLNQYCFINCVVLERLTLPNSVSLINTGLLATSNINILELSNSISSYSATAFAYLNAVEKIYITNNEELTLNSNCFGFMYGLKELTITGKINKIAGASFSSNYSCIKYDFRGCTRVPTLSNVSAFANINTNCKIIVPDSLYENWITANNWSTYSSYIVKASEA